MLDSAAERSVLESLVIELIGDDSNLMRILDEAVENAEKAAKSVTAAFTTGFTGAARAAEGAAKSVEKVTEPLQDNNEVMKLFLKESERVFDEVRKNANMTSEEFEKYRKTMLHTLESQRGFAAAAGYTGTALDDLAKKVRTATYEQNKQAQEATRTQQEQEELTETLKRLAAQVASQRNLWAGRRIDDDQFRTSTMALRAELIQLVEAGNMTHQEFRQLTGTLAYAQRGLDSVNRVASRGGLAWTSQIALANQFGQSLRNLGPAGNVAAGALGMVQRGVTSLFQPVTMADVGFKNLAVSVGRFIAVSAPLAAAIGTVAGVAALGKLTVDAAKFAQELENATYRTGLTIEGLQELQHAARSVGVPMEMLSTTMQRLQRRAADANAGNKNLQDAFRALGVQLTDNEGKMRTTEDLLGQVADGLNRVENDADRLALAFKVFDTEGGKLLPLLTKGSEGIRELREEARELGLVISGETILSLSQFQTELETVKQQFEVLKVEVAAAFLPVFRDALLPLIRDELVPWLGNIATRITELSDRLFDASAEGDTFRQELAKNLQVLVSFGQGVVIAAQAVNALVQTLLSGVANLGAFLGTAFSGVDFKAIEQGFRDTEATYRRLQQEVWDDPLKFNVEPWSDEHRALAQEYGRKANEAAAAAVEASGGRLGQAWRAVMENEMGQGFADGALAAVESALAAFDFDLAEVLGGWARDGADRATRPTREALTEFINDTFGGLTNEPPPPGSIAAAEAMVRHYAEAFRNASTDEARITAAALRDEWQAVVDAYLAAFEEEDPLEAAKLWTGRLTAELREGVKNAALDVVPLLEASLARLNDEAASAFDEFGWDSTKYQDTIRKIEFIEAYLAQVVRDYGVVPIVFEPQVVMNIPDAEVSILPDATLPEQTKSAAAALVEFYTRLTRVTDAQAKLYGVTASTRDNYQETVDILEAILPGLDEMSDDYLLVVQLLTQARDRLAQVNEELAKPNPLVQAMRDAAAAAGAVRDAIRDAQVGNVRRELEGIANAAGSVLSVTRGVRGDGILASLLGEDFDETAAEMRHLERVVRDLGGRYDELSGAERIRLTLASNRLKALKAQTQAEQDAADATQAHKTAVEEWMAAVQAIGATDDPLLARVQQLDAWLAEGAITLEEYKAMLAEVAAAQERLNATMNDGAFDAWAEGVNRLGVTLDPVSIALGNLGTMLAENTIDAEQYAEGIEMVNAALDRLEQAAADAEVEKVTAAWETAATQLGDLLGVDLFDVMVSEWAAMREAAKAAFNAGVIGAEELAKALELIGILEVADGFRQVAAELDGIQALVPTLAADLTEAFAQFTAGNTAGAVATAFNAATSAVQSLGDAFSDTANQGEAMLDLLIGGAAGIATAIGGPAMGQAVGAVGNFIKSILGDLTNGLAEIQRQIDQTASRSTYLGDALIAGIAEGATSRVSRGGILGWLGFTKAELDQEAFRSGVAIAENIANGLVNTLRSGDFEEAWKKMTDDILIQGIIQSFMQTDRIQALIERVMNAVAEGNEGQAATHLNRFKDEFREIWELIQKVIGGTDELAVNVTGALTSGFTNALNSSTWDEAWGKATQSMKQTLRDAIVNAFMESAAMNRIFEAFNAALGDALEDGVITDAEMRRLERLYGQTEGPMKELWDALERLGLGFDDLNDTVSAVTNSMQNVPQVFKDTMAAFDSTMNGGAPGSALPPSWYRRPEQPEAGIGVPDRTTITIQGDVYGYEDFEAKVQAAVGRADWRAGLSTHGVPRVG